MRNYIAKIKGIPTETPGHTKDVEIEFDDQAPNFGEAAANLITATVDSRPDPEGRLAELRRRLLQLRPTRRVYAKLVAAPQGQFITKDEPVLPRVRYTAESRSTGAVVTIELVLAKTDEVAPPLNDV